MNLPAASTSWGKKMGTYKTAAILPQSAQKSSRPKQRDLLIVFFQKKRLNRTFVSVLPAFEEVDETLDTVNEAPQATQDGAKEEE